MGEKKPRKCSICNTPAKAEFVAVKHLEGYTSNAIEKASQASADVQNMKRETIKVHIDECLGAHGLSPAAVRTVGKTLTKGQPVGEDVATLVQAEVVQKLKAGEARVTVQHGLQAQQLLDRRDERKKDRELAITLTRLLHAPPPPPEIVSERPPVLIEGEVIKVGP